MTGLRLGGLAIVLAVAATAAPALAVTSSPTIRRVVYSFTWGTTNATEVHTSGLPDSASGSGGSGGMGAVPPSNSGSASGISSYGGGTNDRGTIAVDFVRQQPDGGYVVSISETAMERRSAPEATCVVYGDLTVVCDPNKKITAEELTLLRLLGSNFIDPNQLDAKQHWQRARQGTGSSTVSDFTIAKNANGIMTIDEETIVKDGGARPQGSQVTGTIGYDFNRTIPTSIDEYSIMRSEQGEQYQTVKTQTVLQLQSDSSAKP